MEVKMDGTIPYILASIGSILVVFWLFLFFKYRTAYDQMISALDSKQFPLCELYFIGLGFINLFHINLRTDSGKKKEKKIAEVYGERYAYFYHCCIEAGKITYLLTLLPVGFYLGILLDDNVMAVLGIVAVFAIVFYLDMQVNNAVENKIDEILSEYPEVLSKLTLLVNAGMVIREAWNRVAQTGDSYIYKEMQITSSEMQNGVSDMDALYNFSQRCGVKEIRKFSSILTQNIQKGGSELAASMKYMNIESWEEKKQNAKRKGEIAGQKLMLPLMLMFVGILIMVIVPIFMNMF